jgi:hypothetical protein
MVLWSAAVPTDAATRAPLTFGLSHKLSYANKNPDDPYDKEWKKPNTEVVLYPEGQNTPLDASQAHLRPPPPRIPDIYDIFVGLSSFRDGHRCGYTIFTGVQRATNPHRLYFGVVDQVNADDPKCLDEYCKLAQREWPDEENGCKYKAQIQIDEHRANDSRGPTLARHYQQKMVGNQTFCLQLDAHSVFTQAWDDHIVTDWNATQNEMAVLTTYLHHIHTFVDRDGRNNRTFSSTSLSLFIALLF